MNMLIYVILLTFCYSVSGQNNYYEVQNPERQSSKNRSKMSYRRARDMQMPDDESRLRQINALRKHQQEVALMEERINEEAMNRRQATQRVRQDALQERKNQQDFQRMKQQYENKLTVMQQEQDRLERKHQLVTEKAEQERRRKEQRMHMLQMREEKEKQLTLARQEKKKAQEEKYKALVEKQERAREERQKLIAQLRMQKEERMKKQRMERERLANQVKEERERMLQAQREKKQQKMAQKGQESVKQQQMDEARSHSRQVYLQREECLRSAAKQKSDELRLSMNERIKKQEEQYLRFIRKKEMSTSLVQNQTTEHTMPAMKERPKRIVYSHWKPTSQVVPTQEQVAKQLSMNEKTKKQEEQYLQFIRKSKMSTKAASQPCPEPQITKNDSMPSNAECMVSEPAKRIVYPPSKAKQMAQRATPVTIAEKPSMPRSYLNTVIRRKPVCPEPTMEQVKTEVANITPVEPMPVVPNMPTAEECCFVLGMN